MAPDSGFCCKALSMYLTSFCLGLLIVHHSCPRVCCPNLICIRCLVQKSHALDIDVILTDVVPYSS